MMLLLLGRLAKSYWGFEGKILTAMHGRNFSLTARVLSVVVLSFLSCCTSTKTDPLGIAKASEDPFFSRCRLAVANEVGGHSQDVRISTSERDRPLKAEIGGRVFLCLRESELASFSSSDSIIELVRSGDGLLGYYSVPIHPVSASELEPRYDLPSDLNDLASEPRILKQNQGLREALGNYIEEIDTPRNTNDPGPSAERAAN